MDVPQGMDSKFRFILISARRARQLQAGSKPLVQTATKKVTKIAQMEVDSGLVPFELLEPVATENEKAKKSKSAK